MAQLWDWVDLIIRGKGQDWEGKLIGPYQELIHDFALKIPISNSSSVKDR